MNILSYFSLYGTPSTGLSPTIRIRDISDNSLVVTDAAMAEVGDGFYREQGLFQVSLFYPLQTGTLTAATRAQAIRTAFKRGTTMTSGSVKVIVDLTPENRAIVADVIKNYDMLAAECEAAAKE